MTAKRGRRRRIALRVLGGTALTVALLVALASCTTTITPPTDVTEPATVFLVDYGRHTSLVLPDPPDGVIEYAYGEWRWFALDDSEWNDTFRTVLSPSEGALGRRHLDVPPEEAALAQAIYAEHVHPIVVERSSADALRLELGTRYNANVDTAHYQALYDLTFVHDDDAYHVGHNCNHAVAAWLESMGCTVSGPRITADFSVRAVTNPS